MFKLFRKFFRTILVSILILGLCLFPSDELPNLDLPIAFADLIVHFIMFGAMSAALYLDLSKIRTRLSNIWIAIGISMGFGIITELLQYLIVILNRTGNIFDLLFDFLGAIVAVLFMHFIKQKFASAS